MFTGIVEARGRVLAWDRRGTGGKLLLELPSSGSAGVPPTPFAGRLGESIAVSGVCLTLVEGPSGVLAFDLSPETLSRTWFSTGLTPGREVNLERALCLGERLGGHLVFGHVDGLGHLVGREPDGAGGARMTFEVAPGLERYLIEKGSIAVDGVSLTVVAPRGRRFDVALIPHTLAATTLAALAPGGAVHLEADAIGKWVEQLVAPYAAPAPSSV
jgi:riboflavin synthase